MIAKRPPFEVAVPRVRFIGVLGLLVQVGDDADGVPRTVVRQILRVGQRVSVVDGQWMASRGSVRDRHPVVSHRRDDVRWRTVNDVVVTCYRRQKRQAGQPNGLEERKKSRDY